MPSAGATRFCMGAAWRNPHERDMPYLKQMVQEVKSLGMETCMTLGMLSENQANELAEAGLDYYNHNLDTSPEYYGDIITTRTYQQRLDTLANVRAAGMKVCSGGIVGMGEQATDRAGLLQQLANLEQHPDSVPINMLVKVAGTPLDSLDDLDPLEFVRTIAVARIMMPLSRVRLSAGRENMTDELQAMCFFAGANSIFYGCKLLTTANPEENDDMSLFRRLGLTPEQGKAATVEEEGAEIARAAAKAEAISNKAQGQFYDAGACNLTSLLDKWPAAVKSLRAAACSGKDAALQQRPAVNDYCILLPKPQANHYWILPPMIIWAWPVIPRSSLRLPRVQRPMAAAAALHLWFRVTVRRISSWNKVCAGHSAQKRRYCSAVVLPPTLR